MDKFRVMNGYEWGIVDLTMTWAFCCDAEQVHRDMVVSFPLTANSTAKVLVIPVWTKMILPNAVFLGGVWMDFNGFHMNQRNPSEALKHRGLLARLPQADDAAFANELDFSYEVRRKKRSC